MQKRIMLVFPGQGTQYIGMLNKLSGDYYLKDFFIQKASKSAGFDLYDICENSTDEELTITNNAQPALLLSEYIAYRRLTYKYDISPIFFAGHSLGEISALACCGALNFDEAIALAAARGSYMAEACDNGAMAAVFNTNEETIRTCCEEDGRVVISNYNSPDQIIISGNVDGIVSVCAELENKGARTTRLNVSSAFHSPYMKSAQEKLRSVLNNLHYNYFAAPVISNCDAKPYCSPDLIADRLERQLVSSVRWTDTIHYASKMGINTVIEVGPKSVLKNLISKIDPTIDVYSVDDSRDYERLSAIFPEKKINGCDYAKIVRRSIGIAVCVKNENYDDASYQKGVIEPYKRLQQMKENIENGMVEASSELAREAVKELKTIIRTKCGTDNTIRMRVQQLLRESDALEEFSDML